MLVLRMCLVPYIEAFGFDAWQTHSLLGVTITSMTTLVCLVATVLHQFDTVWIPADILKVWISTEGWLVQFFHTESALESFLLACGFLTC